LRCSDLYQLDGAAYGETYAAGSRCFMSTLTSNSYVFQDSTQPRCYAMQCSGTNSLSVVVGGKVVPCPSSGGEVTVSGYQGNDMHHSSTLTLEIGTITCPAASLICSNVEGPAFSSVTPSVGTDHGGTPITILGI